MSASSIFYQIPKLGYHYYPDTMHYGEKDLQVWLPELRKIGASWITLMAPINRAIPEFFINGLIKDNIEPVVHFNTPSFTPIETKSYQVLFESYSRWGIRYVVLFDRPNMRHSWSSKEWAKPDLVERFIDLFLPLANLAVESGLIPVFPPLEPGGDYWDTSFLKNALISLQRRVHNKLLDKLVLGIFALSGNRPVNWGAGGPERWPGARPYDTSPGIQDQIGFRIYEWYADISKATLGRILPMLLLRAGCQLGNQVDVSWPPVDELTHAKRNLEIANLLVYDQNNALSPEGLPQEVLACNFWLLAADNNSVYCNQAWYRFDGENLIIVDQLRRWVASHLSGSIKWEDSTRSDKDHSKNNITNETTQREQEDFPIRHYLLLPIYSWGVADWDFELIQPLIEKFHPTIGFSLKEARHASRVTVVGNRNSISEKAVQMLQDAGCIVEQLNNDGIVRAS